MLVATLSTLTPRMRFAFKKPVIENFAFKLHYQLTVTMLLGFVILVCAREYFGDHIRCLSDQGVPPNVIQTYCFFMATFTIVSNLLSAARPLDCILFFVSLMTSALRYPHNLVCMRWLNSDKEISKNPTLPHDLSSKALSIWARIYKFVIVYAPQASKWKKHVNLTYVLLAHLLLENVATFMQP